MHTRYTAGLPFTRTDKWSGKTGYEIDQFDKGGRIGVAYAWLLAPILTHRVVSLRAGYALTYTHSSQNRLMPLLPLSTILANYRTFQTDRAVRDAIKKSITKWPKRG
jgi:hypothetical protein